MEHLKARWRQKSTENNRIIEDDMAAILLKIA
jgi:hypothetical protein